MRQRSIGFFLLFLLPGIISAEKLSFTANSVSYTGSGTNQRTLLNGNVRLQLEGRRIQADAIEILGDDYQYIEASGGVIIDDWENDLYITGRTLIYDREKKVFWISRLALVEDRSNDVVVRCGYIEYREQEDIFQLEVNVRIYNDTILCRSEFSRFERESQTLELSGNPVVFKDDNRFGAATILVNLNTDDITMRDSVTGEVVTESDPPPEETKETGVAEQPGAETAPPAETETATNPESPRDETPPDAPLPPGENDPPPIPETIGEERDSPSEPASDESPPP